MTRYVVPARVQRAEQMLYDMRIAVHIARLNAARTAQRAAPTSLAVFRCAHWQVSGS